MTLTTDDLRHALAEAADGAYLPVGGSRLDDVRARVRTRRRRTAAAAASGIAVVAVAVSGVLVRRVVDGLAGAGDLAATVDQHRAGHAGVVGGPGRRRGG